MKCNKAIFVNKGEVKISNEWLKGEDDNFEEFDCVKMNDQDVQQLLHGFPWIMWINVSFDILWENKTLIRFVTNQLQKYFGFIILIEAQHSEYWLSASWYFITPSLYLVSLFFDLWQRWERVQQVMDQFSQLIKDAESLDNGEFRFKDEL